MRQLQCLAVNACTGLNLVLGLIAILACTQGATRVAAWCLFAAVFLDAADGFLARLWRVDSEFGAQFDSLADMSTFIVAGAVVAFYWFSPTELATASVGSVVSIGLVASLYLLTGACRLARFNTTLKADGEFQGMPTTAVAGLVGVTYLTFPQMNPHWGICWLVMLSFLMISVFPYPKWSRVVRYPLWFWAMLLVGGLLDLNTTVWTCEVAYILSGPLIWTRRRLDADRLAVGVD